MCVTVVVTGPAHAGIISTSGTVAPETSPYPPPSDSTIFVFREQLAVPFDTAQPLNFGSIAAGTPVHSFYLQFDPASPTASVGTGSVTFAGPVLGVITSTNNLNATLTTGNSDSYFGLADTLGPYPTGADPGARGLGSPNDDLIFSIGSNTFTVDSLDVPVAGNLDALRVLTGMILGDINCDGFVDIGDLAVVGAQWGTAGTLPFNADIARRPPPTAPSTSATSPSSAPTGPPPSPRRIITPPPSPRPPPVSPASSASWASAACAVVADRS
ncbi:MAG: hypothetical protein CMJ49_13170 [Planctomycetaceae bacterium]|nr:hypothetical protein [Planctomycetaceae bacterium]